MSNFLQCKHCREEYEDVHNRRFFSQTNSCGVCGISLSISKKEQPNFSAVSETVLSLIHDYLSKEKIIAVKAVGGYLLLCSAASPRAIQLLRHRKRRPHKPFAILYPTIEAIQNHFHIHKNEEELLCSKEAPVVLLQPAAEAFNHVCLKEIAPGLNRIGVMLSGNALLYLIANDFGAPLIATSGNISGSPIIYKDDDADKYLFDIADYVVKYNREIIVPQDDSVIQYSKQYHQKIILRRSRGYAPSFLHYHPKKNETVLAMGAFLKSSFYVVYSEKYFYKSVFGKR